LPRQPTRRAAQRRADRPTQKKTFQYRLGGTLLPENTCPNRSFSPNPLDPWNRAVSPEPAPPVLTLARCAECEARRGRRDSEALIRLVGPRWGNPRKIALWVGLAREKASDGCLSSPMQRARARAAALPSPLGSESLHDLIAMETSILFCALGREVWYQAEVRLLRAPG
jgi:hypothetical protein